MLQVSLIALIAKVRQDPSKFDEAFAKSYRGVAADSGDAAKVESAAARFNAAETALDLMLKVVEQLDDGEPPCKRPRSGDGGGAKTEEEDEELNLDAVVKDGWEKTLACVFPDNLPVVDGQTARV